MDLGYYLTYDMLYRNTFDCKTNMQIYWLIRLTFQRRWYLLVSTEVTPMRSRLDFKTYTDSDQRLALHLGFLICTGSFLQ